MANLEKALKKVLKWEGGYANDPDDTGGETMKGVTMATYKEYCRRKGLPEPTSADLKKLTNATIIDLADTLFWSKIRGNEIDNQSIAELCFDCVWGSGLGYIKVMQKVLGVTADGVVGPVTIAKINNWTPQKDLFNKLWNRRKTYLEGCKTAWKYLRGWMNRLNSYKFVEEPKEEENEIEEANSAVTTHANDASETIAQPTAGTTVTTVTKTETMEKKSIWQAIIGFIAAIFKNNQPR